MNIANKINRQIGELLLFTVVFAALLSKIFDFDIWYHLSIGREVFTSLSIPKLEFLVYTNAANPVMLNEWGFGVLLYLAYQLGGLPALTIFNALTLTAILWLLYRAAGNSQSSLAARILVLAGLLVWGVHYSRYFRPEIILYLALAAELFLLEKFLIKQDLRWLLPIPPLALALAQAHPSAIFLIFVLGCYGLHVVWLNRHDKARLVKTGSWFLACIFATIITAAINPYGFAQLVEPFLFARESKVHSQVAEFIPVLSSPQKWTFLVVLGCAAVSVVYDKSRLILNSCLIIAFGVLALRYQRNLTLLTMVAYLPVSHALSEFLKLVSSKTRARFQRKRWLEPHRFFVVVAGLSIVLAFVHESSLSRWGFGIVAGALPTKSALVINTVKPKGRVFNHYDFGGYLGWALQGNYQVFIDGRNNRMRRSLAMHNSIMQANAGWETALQRYDINTIVVPTVTLVTGTLYTLIERLLDDDDWILLAVDNRELLFFRRNQLTEPDQEPAIDKSEGWKQVLFDAQKNAARYPGQSAALYASGLAALKLGMSEEAKRSLERYLSDNPDDPNALRAFRQLESQ